MPVDQKSLAESAVALAGAQVVLARMVESPCSAIIVPSEVRAAVEEGTATTIIKGRRFPVEAPFWLADVEKVVGIVELEVPKEVDAAGFEALRDAHGLSKSDRDRWWPGVGTLFAYGVKSFTPIEPRPHRAAPDSPAEVGVAGVEKAVWTTAYVNSLPDGAFLYIAPGGGKDDEGKTTPRSLRYFPVRDKNGKLDLPHVRNALSRIPQAKIPQSAKAGLMSRARRLLAEAGGTRKLSEGMSASAISRILEEALKDRYPAQEDGRPVYIYICDLFDDFVVYEWDGKLWRLNYTIEDGAASFEGEPQQVQRQYVYVDKGGEPVEIGKPFAGFKDFAACMATMRRRGHKEPNARRICGALRRDYEKALKAESGEAESDTALVFDGQSFPVVLRKADNKKEDEQYVLGIVLEPDVKDSQNEIYSAAEIRKAAFGFMEHHQVLGLMHVETVARGGPRLDNRVRLLETYLAPVDFTLAGQKVRKGSWLIGARIVEPALWAQVKSGELNGWSIGGFAAKTPELDVDAA